MRIGFDAKRIFQNTTGLGNYSRLLVSSMAKHFPQNEYLLFTPYAAFHTQAQNIEGVETITGRNKTWGGLWRSYTINYDLQEQKTDVYHGLSNELPFRIQKTGIKTVVTIHDVIFKRFPQHYSVIDRNIYDIKWKNACRYADVILATSEVTKQDIIQFYGTDAQKIKVVYQSCDEMFFEAQTSQVQDEIKTKYQLPAQFILYVGSITERKNLLNICKAYLLMKDEERLPCVVIGKGGKYAKQVKEFIASHKLEKYFLFREQVPAAELPAFYMQAMFFIYPSLYEGFGIPVLEAMAAGCPVITSNISSMPEVAGNAALFVHPQNISEISDAMLRFAQSTSLRETYILKGKEQAQKFTALKSITPVMEVYKSLCS